MDFTTQIILTTVYSLDQTSLGAEIRHLTDNLDWALGAELDVNPENPFEEYVTRESLPKANPNVIHYLGNEDVFKEVLGGLQLARNNSFVRYRNYFLAPEIPITGNSGHVFGIETAATEKEAKDRMLENSLYSKLWQNLLASPGLDSYSSRYSSSYYSLQNAMNKLFDLTGGVWGKDSLFYDAISDTSDASLALHWLTTKNTPNHFLNDYTEMENELVLLPVKFDLN